GLRRQHLGSRPHLRPLPRRHLSPDEPLRLRPGPIPLIIKEYRFWVLSLHEGQQYLGRSVAALKSREVIDPFLLPPEVQQEFTQIALDFQRACAALFQPDLFNYANLRNAWSVCHWHLIPRYASKREFAGFTFDDQRWGKNYLGYESMPNPTPEIHA